MGTQGYSKNASWIQHYDFVFVAPQISDAPVKITIWQWLVAYFALSPAHSTTVREIVGTRVSALHIPTLHNHSKVCELLFVLPACPRPGTWNLISHIRKTKSTETYGYTHSFLRSRSCAMCAYVPLTFLSVGLGYGPGILTYKIQQRDSLTS